MGMWSFALDLGDHFDYPDQKVGANYLAPSVTVKEN